VIRNFVNFTLRRLCAKIIEDGVIKTCNTLARNGLCVLNLSWTVWNEYSSWDREQIHVGCNRVDKMNYLKSHYECGSG